MSKVRLQEIVLRKKLNLIYFLVTGTLVFSLSYPFVIFFSLIGNFSKTAWRIHGVYMMYVIRFYQAIQPWKSRNIKINIPKELHHKKIVLISNHKSYLDVFIYLTQFRNLRVAASNKLFKLPIFGTILKLFRQIPFKKGDIKNFAESIELARQGIRDGDRILFFPELTRSEFGTPNTNKFYSFPFRLAVEEEAYIIPLVIKGSDHSWPKGKFEMDFRAPLSIKSLDAVHTKDFSSLSSLMNNIQGAIDSELVNEL